MPSDLLPVDAPVQSRRYLSPSSTSLKDGKNKSKSGTSGRGSGKKKTRFADVDEYDDEEDELNLSPSLPGTSTSSTSNAPDSLAAKRLQNTLAARRSRRRKLEYQRELEVRAEKAERERDMWGRRERSVELHAWYSCLSYMWPQGSFYPASLPLASPFDFNYSFGIALLYSILSFCV